MTSHHLYFPCSSDRYTFTVLADGMVKVENTRDSKDYEVPVHEARSLYRALVSLDFTVEMDDPNPCYAG